MTDNIVQKLDSVLEGLKNYNVFEQTHQFVQERALELPWATIASHKWQLRSLDIKTAFLQGKQIQRNVFLLPPKEANTNNLWHLKKYVYGLADVSRYWYLRVKEEFAKLNGHICPADQGIFIWHHNNQLIGIITWFIDDIIWNGNQYFYKAVTGKLKTTFKIGSESLKSWFEYKSKCRFLN